MDKFIGSMNSHGINTVSQNTTTSVGPCQLGPDGGDETIGMRQRAKDDHREKNF